MPEEDKEETKEKKKKKLKILREIPHSHMTEEQRFNTDQGEFFD